jgi:hypothetical protein
VISATLIDVFHPGKVFGARDGARKFVQRNQGMQARRNRRIEGDAIALVISRAECLSLR